MPLEDGLGEQERELLAMLAERLRLGAREYGVLNVDESTKDFTHEALEELLDSIAYISMKLMSMKRGPYASSLAQIRELRDRIIGPHALHEHSELLKAKSALMRTAYQREVLLDAARAMMRICTFIPKTHGPVLERLRHAIAMIEQDQETSVKEPTKEDVCELLRELQKRLLDEYRPGSLTENIRRASMLARIDRILSAKDPGVLRDAPTGNSGLDSGGTAENPTAPAATAGSAGELSTQNLHRCTCGKYRGIKQRGIVCEKCGVEVK